MNVTGVTEEVRQAFGLGHAQITELAERVPPGCNGVMFLPYLQGERVPNLPHASGALLGLRSGSLNPGVLFRAAIEGTTLGLVAGVERMKRLGLVVEAVRVVGGGSKNRLWRQILSDALGVEVSVLAEPESAALGGALQANWVARRAAGEAVSIDDVAAPFVTLLPEVTRPDSRTHAVYQKQLEEFRSTTEWLFEQ
jgi:xylulokinase